MMPFFDAAAPTDSVFTEKGALDPLAAPDDIRGRETQQAQLARLLGGVTEGYLPLTVAIHGSPGIGKTMTTRWVCREFAARHEAVAVEIFEVNGAGCRRGTVRTGPTGMGCPLRPQRGSARTARRRARSI
mgnify:CR=1 FL=1|jgi:cell division control protein 6